MRASIVLDREDKLVGCLVVEHNPDTGCMRRMFECIGKGFLRDAIRGKGDVVWQEARRSHDFNPHINAARIKCLNRLL